MESKEKFGCSDLPLKKSRGEKPPTQEYLNFLLEGKSFLSREYFDELSRIR